MRVLVLGGSGFVGGRLCDHFLDIGLNVTIGSRSTSKTYQANNKYQIIPVDLKELDRVIAAFQQFDIVVNASGANADTCANNPIDCFDDAKQQAEAMMKAAKEAKVKRLVNLSSIKVYGVHPNLIDEACECLSSTPYAIVKREIERNVLSANFFDSSPINFRLSNSFGAPAKHCLSETPNLINDLCKNAVINNEIFLKVPNLQRDFIPVSSVVSVIGEFLTSDDKRVNCGIYNLCAGKNLTLREVGVLIEERAFEILGSRPKLINGNEVHAMPLERYSNQQLQAAGVKIDTDLIPEIDGLLRHYAREL